MFKKLLCISAAFVLCLSSFIIPSYADDSIIFPSIPIVESRPTKEQLYELGFPYMQYFPNENTYTYYCAAGNENAINAYCFTYTNSPYNTFVIAGENLQDGYYAEINDNANHPVSGNANTMPGGINTDFNLKYYYGSVLGVISSDIPNFDTLLDGLSALRNFIDNPPGPSLPNDGFEGTLLVEAGYVAYIRVNGGDMKLTATMNELSGLSLGGSPWGNTSSIAYGVSNLPSQGTTFPLNSMSHIPWMKQAQGQNWLGQTRYAGYPRSGLTTDDNYIVIYNPAQPYLSSKGMEELSPTITAKFSKLVDYKKYPLTQSYDSVTGGTSSNSISDFDDFYNGEADSNGSFSETPSNTSMSPVATPGGTGDLATSGQLSVTEYIQQVNNTLTNFAKSVIDLLKAPISHVGELISAGSGFMGALRGLYGWLPVDIQGLVISALTVVIGIGVFKVFL